MGSKDHTTPKQQFLTLRHAWLFAAASGFLALAWEMAWARLFNYATASRAIAFGALLGSYLFGLALGSLLCRRWQRERESKGTIIENPLPFLARLILSANCLAFLVLPLASWLVLWVWWPWTLLLVMLGAVLLGVVLPMLCQLAIQPEDKVGPQMASIYLANIMGSGGGSLIVGFLLMNWLPMKWLTVLLLLGGIIMAFSMARLGGLKIRSSLKGWLLYPALVLLLGFVGMSGLWERLQYRKDYQWGMQFAKVIESKHGVITVDSNRTVYGNGVYDGALKTSLNFGSWLARPYFIAGLHPKPERVLVIGVSGGAWTQILVHHPDVKEVVGVELSGAYLKLIKDSPEVSSLLSNPKVSMVVDDGRRWLKRNPDRRFDLIVMNTTHHWREFASSLLSVEFLELARQHLAEGGIVAWNTTESARAAKTGMTVFPHTLLLQNFCIASMQPLQPDKDRWRRALEKWQIEGVPVFDLTAEQGRAEMEKVLTLVDHRGSNSSSDHWNWMPREEMEAKFGSAEVITDDNLGHEFQWGNW